MHAPLSTVELFPRVSSDARKVADAMLLEADWAISNVTSALNSNGMLNNSVFFVHTDNGGPGSHACNFPLRGGKFTFCTRNPSAHFRCLNQDSEFAATL